MNNSSLIKSRKNIEIVVVKQGNHKSNKLPIVEILSNRVDYITSNTLKFM